MADNFFEIGVVLPDARKLHEPLLVAGDIAEPGLQGCLEEPPFVAESPAKQVPLLGHLHDSILIDAQIRRRLRVSTSRADGVRCLVLALALLFVFGVSSGHAE